MKTIIILLLLAFLFGCYTVTPLGENKYLIEAYGDYGFAQAEAERQAKAYCPGYIEEGSGRVDWGDGTWTYKLIIKCPK